MITKAKDFRLLLCERLFPLVRSEGNELHRFTLAEDKAAGLLTAKAKAQLLAIGKEIPIARMLRADLA